MPRLPSVVDQAAEVSVTLESIAIVGYLIAVAIALVFLIWGAE